MAWVVSKSTKANSIAIRVSIRLFHDIDNGHGKRFFFAVHASTENPYRLANRRRIVARRIIVSAHIRFASCKSFALTLPYCRYISANDTPCFCCHAVQCSYFLYRSGWSGSLRYHR